MLRVDAIAMPEHSAGPAPQPRLVKAAHEFEAQMMKELLKPMTQVDDWSGDHADVGGGGILGEFGAEALGRALSEQGGLGIATGIVQSLPHSGKCSQFEPAVAGQAKGTSNT